MSPRNLAKLATIVLTVGLGHSAAYAQEVHRAGHGSDTSPRVGLKGSNVEDLIMGPLDSPGAIALDVVAAEFSGTAMATTDLHVEVRAEGANSITVAPGAQVRYEVMGVLSDDANEGLALVGFSLVFDGGDLPQADSPTGEPTPGCDNPMINFTRPWGITNPAGYGGTMNVPGHEGDLVQVGGAQNTINNTPDVAPFPIGPVLTGVAQAGGCGPTVLVTGTLTAPDVVGTYTLAVTELFGNVIVEEATGDPFWETAATGIGTVRPLAILVSEVALPLSRGQRMYWANAGRDRIQCADLDGLNAEDLVTSGLETPAGIALDLVAGKMYWTDAGTSKIQRANLDGSSVEDLVTTGLSAPWGIALDVAVGKMYWTDSHADKVQRANMDGSEVEDLVTSGMLFLRGIALDPAGGKMYWADLGGKIRRANLDGSSVEMLVTIGGFPQGIALDLAAGKMYWADTGGAGPGSIHRADLDGWAVENIVTTGLSSPTGVALDVPAGKIYWTDWDGRKIQRANLDGSDVEDLVTTGLVSPWGIALDLRSATIPAALDIKPGSCPNPVNVRSRGVVPMAVVGTESFDVTAIDTDSLILGRADGVGGAVTPIAKRSLWIGTIEDVATPFAGDPCDCHDLAGDGFEDLVIRFSTQRMATVLELGSESRGASVMLTVSGSLVDGTEFEASDCIVITGRISRPAQRAIGKRRTR